MQNGDNGDNGQQAGLSELTREELEELATSLRDELNAERERAAANEESARAKRAELISAFLRGKPTEEPADDEQENGVDEALENLVKKLSRR